MNFFYSQDMPSKSNHFRNTPCKVVYSDILIVTAYKLNALEIHWATNMIGINMFSFNH